jgi:hypothetical protein
VCGQGRRDDLENGGGKKPRYSRKEYEEMAKEEERRGPRMNVYSMIFSEKRGTKKTCTLASHRETNALTHPVKANTTTFSHTLPFVAAEVREWSSLYLVLWFDAWSRMTLSAVVMGPVTRRTKVDHEQYWYNMNMKVEEGPIICKGYFKSLGNGIGQSL